MPAVECSAAAALPELGESMAEKRRRRRLIANRESARRSRARKQRLMEGLHCLVDGLRAENRELANRIAAITVNCHALHRHNSRLLTSSSALHRRLSDLRRLLVFQQLTSAPYEGFVAQTELIA